MGNGIDSKPKMRIIEQILNSMERAEDVDTLIITTRILPPIQRFIWNQLPIIVQDILENEHGYNHYNPQTDSIESQNVYIKE